MESPDLQTNICLCKRVANPQKSKTYFISMDFEIKEEISQKGGRGIMKQMGQNGTKRILSSCSG
jgi:hypothetical protein